MMSYIKPDLNNLPTSPETNNQDTSNTAADAMQSVKSSIMAISFISKAITNIQSFGRAVMEWYPGCTEDTAQPEEENPGPPIELQEINASQKVRCIEDTVQL